MNKRKIDVLYLFTIFLLALFVILSFFDVINIITYIGSNSDIVADSKITSMNNLPIFMFVLCLFQIFIILKKEYKLQKWAIILSLFCAIWSTYLCEFNRKLDEYFMNGCWGIIYSTTYKITTLGYVVIVISWLIVLLQFVIARKLKREQKDIYW